MKRILRNESLVHCTSLPWRGGWTEQGQLPRFIGPTGGELPFRGAGPSASRPVHFAAPTERVSVTVLGSLRLPKLLFAYIVSRAPCPLALAVPIPFPRAFLPPHALPACRSLPLPGPPFLPRSRLGTRCTTYFALRRSPVTTLYGRLPSTTRLAPHSGPARPQGGFRASDRMSAPTLVRFNW